MGTFIRWMMIPALKKSLMYTSLALSVKDRVNSRLREVIR